MNGNEFYVVVLLALKHQIQFDGFFAEVNNQALLGKKLLRACGGYLGSKER